MNSHPKLLLLFNKSDLYSSLQNKPLEDLIQSSLESKWSHVTPPFHIISCQTGVGLTDFEKQLQKSVSDIIYGENGSHFTENILITRQRHRLHLLNCVEHLDTFLKCNLTMDLAAEELRLVRYISLFP